MRELFCLIHYFFMKTVLKLLMISLKIIAIIIYWPLNYNKGVDELSHFKCLRVVSESVDELFSQRVVLIPSLVFWAHSIPLLFRGCYHI